jgi:hypothetical protein
VTIRILADREPYSSFSDESAALVIMNGPSALDAPDADFVVLPAVDFLAMGSLAARGRRGTSFIAYGPVGLMEEAFAAGASDYLREPWSLPELHARLSRLRNAAFCWGRARCSLEGRSLRGQSSVPLGDGEFALFSLLLRSAPLPITREAAQTCLAAIPCTNPNLGQLAVSLRRRLDEAEPGMGKSLHAVRGLGYRLDVIPCG